jgi:transposase-like protein
LRRRCSEELNQHLKHEGQEFLESDFDHDYDLNSDFDGASRVHNRRNGYNSKTLKTKESAFVLNTPRDRNSSFEPQIVKKGQQL